MNEIDQIDKLGEQLMHHVRDPAISQIDRLLRFADGAGAVGGGPTAERWRSHLQTIEAAEAIGALAPDIVDQVLYELLDAIDHGKINVLVQPEDGEPVPLSELGMGELAGWLVGGEHSWRARYSRERFS